MHTRILNSVGSVLLAGILSLSSVQSHPATQSDEGLNLGQAAPDFTLANIEGKRVQLKGYRGKKSVVLVFYPALFRAGG